MKNVSFRMHLAACTAIGAVVAALPLANAGVMVPANATYVKECGACHMPYSPQLLPAASWKKITSHLDDHFGDSAKLDASTQSSVTDYLVANSADRANSSEARAIMQSVNGGAAPERITQVPYIRDLHAAVLDPTWNGHPRPKTLTECGVCHRNVSQGNFTSKTFSVSDEAFRGR